MTLKEKIIQDLQHGKALITKAWWHAAKDRPLICADLSEITQAGMLENNGAYCAITAVVTKGAEDSLRIMLRTRDPSQAFRRSLAEWNDAPERTLAEVQDLYDATIAYVDRTWD